MHAKADVTLLSEAGQRAYFTGYRALHEHLKTPPPAAVHPGLYRHAAIRAFHQRYLQPTAVDSPLAAIAAPAPGSEPAGMVDYGRMVAEVMTQLPWTETYGLSYADTMALPVAEWRRLLAALQAKLAKQPAAETTDFSKQLLELVLRHLPRGAPT